MARTWESRRLAHERDMDQRLQADLTALAGDLGRIVLRFATTPNDEGAYTIPNTRQTRERVTQAAWDEVLKPYFIGLGTDMLDGPMPQSPFARLLVDGIRGAIVIQAERQISLIDRLASDRVRAWLTGLRPFGQRESGAPGVLVQEQGPPWYDPFHRVVNPNGYRLSDAGWRTSVETRKAINGLLDYHIASGTPAVEIAKLLEGFLWPEARRVRTRTPYGTDGSYWARRLARTEITAAAGRSMINASLANPFVEGIKWNLSLSHPCCDICDDYAGGGENGDGVYAKTDVPPFPAHPFELCYLTPETVSNPAAVNAQWETWIDERTPDAMALRGAFDRAWLVDALLYGWIIDTVFDVVFEDAA
jgi:hypothetical protein